mmetsp:Transcript_29299/g.69747  ORF Transcript_29299/g.69747 Transcript_29299/m.69747 type:complete len:394 (-) Transcript_29299:94-1275(-)
MTLAALSTSCKDKVSPPMILKTTPVASSTGASSNGLEIAATAASSAEVFPDPVPIPIRAVPASCMTLRTSAKSTLISPGLTIISDIPTTPCLRISSATRKEASSGVFSGMISRSLLLDTIITVSTFCLSLSMASVACLIRLRPSKAKGFVTIATVSAPLSLLTSARTGAAPLPVPPPIPLVMKQRSAPLTIAVISSRDSSAASRPISGSPPAPRPRVTDEPMFRMEAPFAFDRPSAWASVLIAQNSTPPIRVSSILSTALPPPPPTPKTLMTQGLKPPSGMSAVALLDSAVPTRSAGLRWSLCASIIRRSTPLSRRTPRNARLGPSDRGPSPSSKSRGPLRSAFRPPLSSSNECARAVDDDDLVVRGARSRDGFPEPNLVRGMKAGWNADAQQ